MSAPAFELPPGLEAQEPAEARGFGRDGVRLLVTNRTHRTVVHARFGDLPQILAPGDVLVLNTSATLTYVASQGHVTMYRQRVRHRCRRGRARRVPSWIPLDRVRAVDARAPLGVGSFSHSEPLRPPVGGML